MTLSLIDTRPNPETRELYVGNIITAFNSADSDAREQGKRWYRSAHELATMISDGNPRMGAGVIAALSANKRWSDNVKLAQAAFSESGPVGHFGDALQKATAILGGADPAAILPMNLKTGNFFRCIADPRDHEAVVIDRHAHDIAVNTIYGNADRGLGTPWRYAALAHCYREAGLRLGVLPLEVQATAWVYWTTSGQKSVMQS